jgi:charged multivesicular body protein 5
MNRLFGAKSTAPKPTLNSAISNVRTHPANPTIQFAASVSRPQSFSYNLYISIANTIRIPLLYHVLKLPQIDTRIESIDVKLAKLNAELSTYQSKLSRMRDGPGKTAIKQKALKVLQQRKMYEGQRSQLQGQSWNMEQAGMMQDNLKNTMVTVDAMKTTTKELKKQYGKVDIDKIDRLNDEMADLMDVGNEIQDAISRSYDVPEEVDEDELDAELEALGDEVELGGMEMESGSAMPGFLEEAGPPQFIDEPPEAGKVKEAAG